MSWLYSPLLPAGEQQSGGAVATSPAIFYYNVLNDGGEIMYLRQSTASQEIGLGRFVDSTDGNTAETSLTIANTDIKLLKHGATTLADKNSGGATHISGGIYYAVLDATDTNTIGNLEVHVQVAGALPIKKNYVILDEAVYDALFGTTALATATNITAAAGIAVSSIGNNVITAASIAADAITDAKVASDVTIASVTGAVGSVTAGVTVTTNNDKTGYSLSAAGIQAIWDAATSALTAVGSIGKLLVDNINATITSRLASASYTAPLDAAGTRAAVGLSSANLDTQLSTIDTVVDSILDDTGTAGVVVNSLTVSAQAAIQQEATDALNAYDPPTKAELDAAVANVSVDEIQPTALADLFNTNSGTTYASAVAGSVVKEIADNAGSSSLTAVAIRQEIDNNSTQLAAIVADTNELQTDLTNGGRLDVILDDIKTDTAAIRTKLKKGSAKNNFKFTMTDSTTGSPLTGLTVAGTISKDGAAFASLTNSVSEMTNGWYKVNLTAGEMNADSIALRFSATGAVTRDFTIFTQA